MGVIYQFPYIIFYIFFITDVIVATILSGFVTSFLISKDEIPPKIPFFFEKDDSLVQRRAGSAMFSGTIFIYIYLIQFFLMSLPLKYDSNSWLHLGLYLVGMLGMFFWGLIFGAIGGKAGGIVRDWL